MKLNALASEMLLKTTGRLELMQLMVSCLNIITNSCPVVGIQAIGFAKKYWVDGELQAKDLERARVKCWEYLDDKSASTNTVEKEFCAMRAVICVMYSESSADNGELVEWFLELLNGVEEDKNILFDKVKLIIKSFKGSKKVKPMGSDSIGY